MRERGFSRKVVAWSVVLFLVSCQRGPGPQSDLQQNYGCVSMQPGMTLPMQTQFGGLPARYSLAMSTGPSGQTLYTASVPVQFYTFRETLSVTPDVLIRNTTAYAAQCLEQAAPYLRGPNGEQLRIELVTGPAPVGLKPQQIYITERPVRGHSTYWTTQWQCPQVVHEVMHLVGLVDAYSDPSVYDCRAVGPADAITVNPDAAYARVGLAGGIPPGGMNSSATLGAAPGAMPGAMPGAGTQSLLYPVEFNAIVSPNCSISRAYAECATNAYRQSSKQGCGQTQLPSCSGGNTSWYSL